MDGYRRCVSCLLKEGRKKTCRQSHQTYRVHRSLAAVRPRVGGYMDGLSEDRQIDGCLHSVSVGVCLYVTCCASKRATVGERLARFSPAHICSVHGWMDEWMDKWIAVIVSDVTVCTYVKGQPARGGGRMGRVMNDMACIVLFASASGWMDGWMCLLAMDGWEGNSIRHTRQILLFVRRGGGGVHSFVCWYPQAS